MANAQLEPVLHRLRHLFHTDQPDALLLDEPRLSADHLALLLAKRSKILPPGHDIGLN